MRVSKGLVRVTGRDGKGYICVAADGSTRVMQRWRLFPVREQGEFDLEQTLGTKEGIIESVVRRTGPGKYLVRWTRPDGRADENITTEYNIRRQNNGTQLLEQFEKQNQPQIQEQKQKEKQKQKNKDREKWGAKRNK
jgi:hypothetical protein